MVIGGWNHMELDFEVFSEIMRNPCKDEDRSLDLFDQQK